MPCSTPSSRAGYTVLELTCAISALAICAFGAIQACLWGMQATKAAREEQAVARLMANELEAWRVAAGNGEALSAGGGQPLRALYKEPDTLAALGGAVRVRPHAPGPVGLMEVRVRVQWRAAGGRNVQREAATLIPGGA